MKIPDSCQRCGSKSLKPPVQIGDEIAVCKCERCKYQHIVTGAVVPPPSEVTLTEEAENALALAHSQTSAVQAGTLVDSD